MGRSIPSITCRVDARLAEWERFAEMLGAREQRSFRKLASLVRDMRTAIDAADDDIGTAMLLAIVVGMKSEMDGCPKAPGGVADDARGQNQPEKPQGGP